MASSEGFISPATDRAGRKSDRARLCWHLAACFFLSVLGSGSHDGWAWCAVSTVTQSSLPLSGEGDLFKILLQASEPCRCPKLSAATPKAGGGGGDDSDKACEPTSEKSQPKISKRRRGSTMTVFSGQCLQSQWNKKGLKLPNDSKGHFWVQLA